MALPLTSGSLTPFKWPNRKRKSDHRKTKTRRSRRRYLAWLRQMALCGVLQISLYRRMPLKSISRLWGRFNQVDLPVFLRRPLIGLYVWLFGCDLQEALEQDLRSYRNLGEFFRRQLREDVRPVDETHLLTSPSDGKVLYHGQVKNGILEQVKGVTYSLRGFLGPQTWDRSIPELTSTSQDLMHQPDDVYQKSLRLRPGNELHHCIIYLAPGDYHRFHSPTTWTVKHRRHFPAPVCTSKPAQRSSSLEEVSCMAM